MGANRQATLGDRASEFEFKRFAARVALREDLRSKPPAGIMALSARVANVGNGLQTRRRCDEEMRDGSLDVGKIYWAGEKFRRVGARSGSNQNLVIWVENSLEGSERSNGPVTREDGEFQGGASVMGFRGLSCRVKGPCDAPLP